MPQNTQQKVIGISFHCLFCSCLLGFGRLSRDIFYAKLFSHIKTFKLSRHSLRIHISVVTKGWQTSETYRVRHSFTESISMLKRTYKFGLRKIYTRLPSSVHSRHGQQHLKWTRHIWENRCKWSLSIKSHLHFGECLASVWKAKMYRS